MTHQLLGLPHKSARQIRDTLRRVTALFAPAHDDAMPDFLGTAEAVDSHCDTWEDTVVDFKWLSADGATSTERQAHAAAMTSSTRN